jgi:hypothetical protein
MVHWWQCEETSTAAHAVSLYGSERRISRQARVVNHGTDELLIQQHAIPGGEVASPIY